MNIAIITDSTCDLSISAEAAYQIDIVPLMVTFGEKAYRDGVDLTNSEFYLRLAKADILPTTSQPTPAAFQEVFRRRLDEGKDIVGIFISSGLSGTYQSAMIARSSFINEEQNRIHLVDSQQATGSLGILVHQACKMRDQGAGAKEIADSINELVPRTRLYAFFDTLKYLKMGGRLSAAAAAAGGLLNISPVCALVNGKLVPIAKIRKRQNVFHQWLREKLLTDIPDPQYSGAFLHSDAPALAAALQEEFKYLLPPDKTLSISLGAVVGTHTGPNAQGVAYIAKEK